MVNQGIAGERTSADTSLLVQQLSQIRRIAHQSYDAGQMLHSLNRFVKEIRKNRTVEPAISSEFEDDDPLSSYMEDEEGSDERP